MFREVSPQGLDRGVPFRFRPKDGAIVGQYWIIRHPASDSEGHLGVRVFDLQEGTLSPVEMLRKRATYSLDAVPALICITGVNYTFLRVVAHRSIPLISERNFKNQLDS